MNIRDTALRTIGKRWLARLAPGGDLALTDVDFHVHTSWTDGRDTAAAMYQRACQLGLKAILFSEHARVSSESWFVSFADEILAFPAEPCQALVGVESRILDETGALDLSPEVAARCHLVVASVHRLPGMENFSQSDLSDSDVLEKEYRLSLAALGNEDADILGHPFGMCLERFHVDPPACMVKELAKTAARQGKAVEINSKYHKRFIQQWLDIFRREGCLISPGSDAHEVNAVGTFSREAQRIYGS